MSLIQCNVVTMFTVNGASGPVQGTDITMNDSTASGTLRMMTAALNSSNERPLQDSVVIHQQQQQVMNQEE